MGIHRRRTVILVWLLTGPIFHFSDTWQLIINTATTIITFLMVFLIQNTQNRDAKAMHLKLDELDPCVKGARNQLVDLEDLSDEDLKKLEEQFQRMRKQAENDEALHVTPRLLNTLIARTRQSSRSILLSSMRSWSRCGSWTAWFRLCLNGTDVNAATKYAMEANATLVA